MGRRSKVAGLTGFGACRRRIARRGNGRRSEHHPEGHGSGLRRAREAHRLRLEPAGPHRREEGGQGDGRQGARRDGLGLRQRRAEPPAARPAGRRPHHRARFRLQRRRRPVAEEFNVPVVVWDASRAQSRRASSPTSSRRHSRARTSRACSRRCSRKQARSASSCRRLTRTGSSSRAATARVRAPSNKGVKFKYARIGQASYADAAGGRRITRP